MVNLVTDSETTRQFVEPLLFRTLDEVMAASFAAQPIAVHVPDPTPPFDIAAALRAAREQGREEAMADAEDNARARIDGDRDVLGRMVLQFQQEKQRYFADVESEVVKLSLAIAERVLHREAEMDPMLLAGVARVALSQITDSSEAVLHVATGDVGRWNDTLKPAPKGLVVEADDAMGRGEVVLKTRSGTVHLGLRVQLQEIERGFFELLGRKPSMLV